MEVLKFMQISDLYYSATEKVSSISEGIGALAGRTISSISQGAQNVSTVVQRTFSNITSTSTRKWVVGTLGTLATTGIAVFAMNKLAKANAVTHENLGQMKSSEAASTTSVHDEEFEGSEESSKIIKRLGLASECSSFIEEEGTLADEILAEELFLEESLEGEKQFIDLDELLKNALKTEALSERTDALSEETERLKKDLHPPQAGMSTNFLQKKENSVKQPVEAKVASKPTKKESVVRKPANIRVVSAPKKREKSSGAASFHFLVPRARV
jgi:hypothetical protein